MMKLMFGSTNGETNEYFSKMIGDRREMMFGGSGGDSGPRRDLGDELLGVSGSYTWNEHYEPFVRPGDFSRLGVAEAILHLGGRILSRGEPFARVNFWRNG